MPTASERLELRQVLAGSLDPSFDGDGRVTTSLSGTQAGDGPEEILVQPDGRLIVAGTVGGSFLIGRFNADGSTDSSFGTSGPVTTQFTGGSVKVVRALLQADGRIVVAGNLTGDGVSTQNSAVLARYNVDGSLDTSFGTGGRLVRTELDTVVGVGRLPDGAYLIGGNHRVNQFDAEGHLISFTNEGTIIRLNSEGILDLTYGTGGKAAIELHQGGLLRAPLLATSFGSQPNGRGVLGYTQDNVGTSGFTTYSYAFVAFNSSGALDTTVGTGGFASIDAGGTLSFKTPAGTSDFITTADGSLRILGNLSATNPPGFASNNRLRGVEITLDGTFRQTFDVESMLPARRIALQSDGKYVLALGDGANNGSLARLNPNGSVDAGFGSNGVVSTTFTSASVGMRAVAIQPDGKIVATGVDGTNLATARYFGATGVIVAPKLASDAAPLETSEAGGTATFSVSLTDAPSSNVTIALTSSRPGEGSLSTQLLTFTPTNFATPQVVTVTGGDDSLPDGERFYSIVTGATGSADANFSGLVVPDVRLVNLDDETTRMYRAFNPNANFHFFTTSRFQFDNAVRAGYKDEAGNRGGFAVLPTPQDGSVPLFRLYNLERGFHYYTVNAAERDGLVNLVPPPLSGPDTRTTGWRYEGIEGQMYPAATTGATTIYRLYNTDSGVHLFTENPAVKDAILAITNASTGIHPWQLHSDLGFAFSISGPDQPPAGPPAAAQAKSASALVAGFVTDGVTPSFAFAPPVASRVALAISAPSVDFVTGPPVLPTVLLTESEVEADPIVDAANAPASEIPAGILDDLWLDLSNGALTAEPGW